MIDRLDAAEALRTLDSDPRTGLAASEAARRLGAYGPNELKTEERPSPWLIFLRQFKNILIRVSRQKLFSNAGGSFIFVTAANLIYFR